LHGVICASTQLGIVDALYAMISLLMSVWFTMLQKKIIQKDA